MADDDDSPDILIPEILSVIFRKLDNLGPLRSSCKLFKEVIDEIVIPFRSSEFLKLFDCCLFGEGFYRHLFRNSKSRVYDAAQLASSFLWYEGAEFDETILVFYKYGISEIEDFENNRKILNELPTCIKQSLEMVCLVNSSHNIEISKMDVSANSSIFIQAMCWECNTTSIIRIPPKCRFCKSPHIITEFIQTMEDEAERAYIKCLTCGKERYAN